MKTIRTIIATLSAVLLTFALLAWFSVRRNAAFLQRTIYQGFDQTFVVALVMGCAFLLIAVILTVAIVSIENDEEDEDEEAPRPVRPRYQSNGARPTSKGEQPYRRVTRPRSAAPAEDAAEDAFARPKGKAAEQPKPKKQRATESPEDVIVREEGPKPKKKHSAPKPAAVIPPETEQVPAVETDLEPAAEQPTPEPTIVETKELPEPEEAPAAEKIPEPEEAPAIEPDAAEKPLEAETAPAEEPEQGAMVRCVFCGGSVGRGIEVCPHCGKKM